MDEAVEKINSLQDLKINWHFIGQIQSNKTQLIAKNFDWVHSVDRFKIARRLSEQRPAHLPPLNLCIQVNIDGEDQKGGVKPEALLKLAIEISTLPNITLRGLMVIPKAAQTLEAQRKPFAQLASLLKSLKTKYPELDTLSMGMSQDLEAALMEGATIVRIGTDIFGPRL